MPYKLPIRTDTRERRLCHGHNLQGPAVSAERHHTTSAQPRTVVKALHEIIEGSEEQFRHDGPMAALAVDDLRHAVWVDCSYDVAKSSAMEFSIYLCQSY